jgi:hypothetical protein
LYELTDAVAGRTWRIVVGSLVDRVTARALRRSLDRSADPERVAHELSDIAESQPWVIAHSLWRLEDAQNERPGAVITRAKAMLADALALAWSTVVIDDDGVVHAA